MKPNRAARLVAILATVAAVGASRAHARDATEPVAVSPESLEFISIPDMPKCASAAILSGDPRSGPAWVLLRLASGCRVPWHWHTANEALVVIGGRGTLAMKDGPPLRFVPGAYTSLPSRHVHQATCTRSCLLFSSADGAFDIHYVDRGGEEISAKRALAPAAPQKGHRSGVPRK